MALRQWSPFSLMYSSNWFWTKFGLDSEICNFKKKKKRKPHGHSGKNLSNVNSQRTTQIFPLFCMIHT